MENHPSWNQKWNSYGYCCEDTCYEENIGSAKSVCAMIMMVHIISFLYERETGKNGVGRDQERDKERMREMD